MNEPMLAALVGMGAMLLALGFRLASDLVRTRMQRADARARGARGGPALDDPRAARRRL